MLIISPISDVPYVMVYMIWSELDVLFDIIHIKQVFLLNIDMSLTILGLECILLFRLTYSIKRYLIFAAILTNLLILTCQAGLLRTFYLQKKFNEPE